MFVVSIRVGMGGRGALRHIISILFMTQTLAKLLQQGEELLNISDGLTRNGKRGG